MPEERTRRQEYWARINRALDYIEAHLDGDLALEEIARAAFFSPYHFHRIFSALMGETVSQFVQRIRLEKAASLLRAHPRRPVTRVALEVGYANHAAFSRAFRATFGQTPSDWRKPPSEAFSKIGTEEGKECKDQAGPEGYSSTTSMDEDEHRKRREEMADELKMDVRVEDLPEVTVAYIRHVGPYAGDSELFQNLFERLFQWAGPRNLLRFPETQILSIYHDDPSVTEEAKLRTSVGISVPQDTDISGEIGKMNLPAGRYAQARFELEPHQYEAAWNTVYGGWLPDSGYQPAEGLPFERYLNDPKDHPQGKHIVEICLPVAPL